MSARRISPIWATLGAVVLLAVAVCLWALEAERQSVAISQVVTPVGPVTLYRAHDMADGPLVVVTHGFAGSRQMMQYISRDLARAGFTVAAFDFIGQGRNPERMSADVTRIEGTTQQLIDQTKATTTALRAQLSDEGPMALVGHSMATDIIIRAAADMPRVDAIVGISMYSDAVTAAFPQRLLILSGAWEGRLRDVGRSLIAQVDGTATEGQTVARGDVVRRAVAVPRTEHVAVLFSEVTQQETRAWLREALGVSGDNRSDGKGAAILGALIGIILLAWPLSRALPQVGTVAQPVGRKLFLAALFIPALPAYLAAVLGPGSVLGTASFGALAAFFGVWGLVALVVLSAGGVRLQRPSGAVLVLLLCAFGAFALCLDRYAAAFVPTGPRLLLMMLLVLGTLPFMLADQALVAHAPWWQRLSARVVPIGVLASAMMYRPGDLGLSFTVLPVLVLFYFVFGTMARAVARRGDVEATGLALGLALAWSIAASTPLFVG